tara:strand:- start:616 stop:1161 length:546 start_codon:yes stop_codon:yes gene_type:complete
MELQEWASGSFQETDTDYKIAGQNILYKNEETFLVKGVELLCDAINPKSVLEFGFGKGWTATEFQRKGVTRHVILEPNIELYQAALTWKANYSTNIDILNIWSWDYSGGETFDLVYDDREPVTADDCDNHFNHMKTILPSTQLYAFNSHIATGDNFGRSIEYTLNGIKYRQSLTEGFYGNG